MGKRDNKSDAGLGCLVWVIIILSMIGGWVQFERWGYVGAWGALVGLGGSLILFFLVFVLFVDD